MVLLDCQGNKQTINAELQMAFLTSLTIMKKLFQVSSEGKGLHPVRSLFSNVFSRMPTLSAY
jgi:hypothetical protein